LCEFKEICGGSRARAYALTGDVTAEEPCCVYQPKRSPQQCEAAAD
jgi:MoaA/NifB/PqqE/SkfB family radical SAM enzyme